MIVKADKIHDKLISESELKLKFREDVDFLTWQKQVKEKFIELLGIKEIEKNACPLNFEIQEEKDFEKYRRLRIVFESEKGMFIPTYLFIPKTKKKKYPLSIALMGHNKGGMINTIGEGSGDREEKYRKANAIQSVENGYAALAVELRGMGELLPDGEKRMWGDMCKYTAFISMALGRTILGERVWDISRAIDVMEKFPEIDTDHIIINGASGGGTASFYSACYDERIKLSAPVCSFCSYEKSIFAMYHCICNLIPNIPQWFEMGDLAGLIAPRKLLVFAGKTDEAFPIDGVNDAFNIAKSIYKKAGVEQNVKLVVMDCGHSWRPDYVWPNINEFDK
jgi:dienelactone hydrolase